MTDLEKLIEAVEAGKCVTVPSVKARDQMMRIMCYCDGYVMARHKGTCPFVVSVRDVRAILRALKAKEGHNGTV